MKNQTFKIQTMIRIQLPNEKGGGSESQTFIKDNVNPIR